METCKSISGEDMKIESKLVTTKIIRERQCENNTSFRYHLDTSSSFDIPARLMPYLESKAWTSGQLSWYLHQLLNKYRFVCYSGQLPRYSGVKTRYQGKGQDLQKRSFRPRNADWAELKMIAALHNTSATNIFVVLLELDFGLNP